MSLHFPFLSVMSWRKHGASLRPFFTTLKATAWSLFGTSLECKFSLYPSSSAVIVGTSIERTHSISCIAWEYIFVSLCKWCFLRFFKANLIASLLTACYALVCTAMHRSQRDDIKAVYSRLSKAVCWNCVPSQC